MNGIQNGGRSHLEIITIVDFGHMAYFRWWLATFLRNLAVIPYNYQISQECTGLPWVWISQARGSAALC